MSIRSLGQSYTAPVERPRRQAAVVLDIILIVLGGFCVYNALNTDSERGFIYFTNLANLIGFVSCVLYFIFLIRELRLRVRIPFWANGLRYLACCMMVGAAVMVTAVLAPSVADGYRYYLFSGVFLFSHFLCPVLTFISVSFAERDSRLTFKATIAGTLPSVLYAMIMIMLNYWGVIDGPYEFLHLNGQGAVQFIVRVAMTAGAAYLIALVIWLLKFIGERGQRRLTF